MKTKIDFDSLPRYLTPQETARVLRISLSSFYKRRFLGQLPVVKLGGSLRVDKRALERFLEHQTTGGDK